MPFTALILYVLYVAIAFGWRSWLQWRRTGDWGIRVTSKSAPALERVAGGAIGLSVLLLGGALVLVPAGRADTITWLDAPLTHVLGIAFVVAGVALTVLAQLQMGDSWRLGCDPSERTALVRHGVFAAVRNPIYTSMTLGALGFALLVPTALAWGAFLLQVVALQIQVRAIEEPHLSRMHGQPYEAYLREVGRFVPVLGRKA